MRFAALLSLLALAGCNPVDGLVERGLEARLPEVIGPADHYAVDVVGLDLGSGEAERVTVVGERVRPADAPVLDRLDLVLSGVRYDQEAERLDRVDDARGTVRVRAADLTAFLDAHRHVRGASLTLRPPDGATLRFRPEAGGYALPEGVAVELAGRLVAEGGHVRFDVEAVRAAGLNLGRTVAARLDREINPVVDLTGGRMRLSVTGLAVETDAVVLTAMGDLAGVTLP